MTNVEAAQAICRGCEDKAFFCIGLLLFHLICSCDSEEYTKLLRTALLEVRPAFFWFTAWLKGTILFQPLN